MFDQVSSLPFSVTVGCARDKASVFPHILYDSIMHVVVKGDAFEFIGLGRKNNGIVLCDSRQ